MKDVVRIVLALTFSVPAYSQPNLEERLAAQFLDKRGTPALPGMAQLVLTEKEQREIAEEATRVENIEKRREHLEGALQMLMEEPNSQFHPKFRFSPRIREEVITKLMRFVPLQGQARNEFKNYLRALSLSQPIYDPSQDEQRLRLSHLAELVAFGLVRSNESRSGGDSESARRYASASLRALIEAYMTLAVSTGRNSDFRQITRFLMYGLSGTALVATLPAYFIGGVPGAVTAMTVSGSTLFLRRQADYRSDKQFRYDLLPDFWRSRFLRPFVKEAFEIFWWKVFILESSLTRTPNLPLAKFNPLSISEMETLTVETLARVSGFELRQLVGEACSDLFGVYDGTYSIPFSDAAQNAVPLQSPAL